MDILLKINEIIKEKRFSQKELAEKLGVSRQVMSNILNGKTEISINFLIKISEVLNVHLLYFFDLSNDMHLRGMAFDDSDLSYLKEQIIVRNLARWETQILFAYHVLESMSKHALIDQILYKISNDKFIDDKIKSLKKEIELLNETNKALKGENEALKTLLKKKTIL